MPTLRHALPAVAIMTVVSQALGQTAAEPAPPPLGVLVPVGGHKMHLYCTGSGQPTVVLEAGAGAFAMDWALVQRGLSGEVRVCSYDRAGLAWSDPGPAPHTQAQAVLNLHALLDAARVKGPYVLVGHSFGGILVRRYAIAYPPEVQGLVLLDPPVENTLQFINGRWTRAFWPAQPRAIPAPHLMIADSERTLSSAEQKIASQILQQVGPPTIDGPFVHLPSQMQRARLWAMVQPGAFLSDNSPYDAEELLLLLADRIRHPAVLGALPLIVIGRTPDSIPANAPPTSGQVLRVVERPDHLRQMGQMSTNSVVVVADSSRHEIHLDQPDLVIEAVRNVIAAARDHAPVRPPTDGAKVLR